MAKEIMRTNTLARLKKIEGQIRGIQKMIENDRYCTDIINQISDARKALYLVSLILIKVIWILVFLIMLRLAKATKKAMSL